MAQGTEAVFRRAGYHQPCPAARWLAVYMCGTVGPGLAEGVSEPLTLQTLALQLAGAANGFSSFASLAFRRLFKVPTQLHFTENAFALHLLLERLERLIDIIVTNQNLHWVVISFLWTV
ncbi:Hypothetical protein GbCGDNIH9_8736 [Granulibacter bethesdensis]|uniref:Uncharacterized protein n=1 Tax=Granulibacter bethesdensis TaxID=364410 RepID=A0AAC9P812_9PROT|nr:Hypothetical protein GbCGDNIH9_8736 [Granulibacter bethesdensis]